MKLCKNCAVALSTKHALWKHTDPNVKWVASMTYRTQVTIVAAFVARSLSRYIWEINTAKMAKSLAHITLYFLLIQNSHKTRFQNHFQLDFSDVFHPEYEKRRTRPQNIIQTFRSSEEYSFLQKSISCPEPPHLKHIMELGQFPWFFSGQLLVCWLLS